LAFVSEVGPIPPTRKCSERQQLPSLSTMVSTRWSFATWCASLCPPLLYCANRGDDRSAGVNCSTFEINCSTFFRRSKGLLCVGSVLQRWVLSTGRSRHDHSGSSCRT